MGEYDLEPRASTYTYTLGEVEEWDGPGGLRQSLHLQEQVKADGKKDGQATGVFEGWLELDPNPIQRRVRIDTMQLDLEDLRVLQQRGKEEAQKRMSLLFGLRIDQNLDQELERSEKQLLDKQLAEIQLVDGKQLHKQLGQLDRLVENQVVKLWEKLEQLQLDEQLEQLSTLERKLQCVWPDADVGLA